MNTKEQALNEAYEKAGYNAYFGNGFEAGVKFATRWNKFPETKPLTFETGEWDGKRGDFVLAKHSNGKVVIARAYDGFMDGFEFFNFYNQEDYELSNIIEWRAIEFI